VPKSGGIPTAKARVVRWFKKEGTKVKQGDPGGTNSWRHAGDF
jgi:glycerol-3-phosphate acyltransferase PlsY